MPQGHLHVDEALPGQVEVVLGRDRAAQSIPRSLQIVALGEQAGGPELVAARRPGQGEQSEGGVNGLSGNGGGESSRSFVSSRPESSGTRAS